MDENDMDEEFVVVERMDQGPAIYMDPNRMNVDQVVNMDPSPGVRELNRFKPKENNPTLYTEGGQGVAICTTPSSENGFGRVPVLLNMMGQPIAYSNNPGPFEAENVPALFNRNARPVSVHVTASGFVDISEMSHVGDLLNAKETRSATGDSNISIPAPRAAASQLAAAMKFRNVHGYALKLFLRALANFEFTLYQWILWLVRRNIEPSDCSYAPMQLNGHTAQVSATVFEPIQRSLMITASFDSEVKFWDVKDWSKPEQTKSLKGHGNTQVSALAISHNGKLLATGASDYQIRLWNLPGGSARATLQGHDGRVTGLQFAPNGRTLASSSWDETIKLWTVRDGQCCVSIPENDMVSSILFSPDGSMLASACEDCTIKFWSNPDCEKEFCLRGHSDTVNTIAFSPCGRIIASGSSDKTVRLWHVATQKEVARIENQQTAKQQIGVKKKTLSRARIELAEARKDSLECDPEDMEEMSEIVTECVDHVLEIENAIDQLARNLGHDHDITAVCFSPDGFLLATGGVDLTVKLWGLPHMMLLTSLSGHTSEISMISFSPSGQHLVVGSRQSNLTVWRSLASSFTV